MKKIQVIIDYLAARYPNAQCSLETTEGWQLLFSTRLAAQCTDKRVNVVARELYAQYPTLAAMAAANLEDLERIIYPCGFFRQKAKDLKSAAGQILDRFGGELPCTMEELTSLSGIGRKTANLILGDVFGKPAIVADTHLIRISNRLGLADSKDPYKVELALKKTIAPKEQTAFCHRAVFFGRDVCKTQRPRCDDCALRRYCTFG